MRKIALILLLCLCSTCYANVNDWRFHQPNLGDTELYNNEVLKDLKVELKMQHSYRKENIFIFPYNFYGESEYYTLGFYVDMDKNIANKDKASDYRILYRNSPAFYGSRGEVIPEPCTLFLLGFGGIILMRKNEKRYGTT